MRFVVKLNEDRFVNNNWKNIKLADVQLFDDVASSLPSDFGIYMHISFRFVYSIWR